MSEMETDNKNMLEKDALRVTSALYRVTDIYSDNEPVKWMLRKDALEFFQYINKYIMAHEAHAVSEDLQHAQDMCRVLRRKLSVARTGGYISKINMQVLDQEYAALSDTITTIVKDISDGLQKDIKDTSPERSIRHFALPKKNERMAGAGGKKNEKEPSSTNERQEAIAGILHGRGWLSVMEITSLHGAGVSVKTVQRDLNTLVEKGALISKGERRWRKYSYAAGGQPENKQNGET